jgi:hypothetical protein
MEDVSIDVNKSNQQRQDDDEEDEDDEDEEEDIEDLDNEQFDPDQFNAAISALTRSIDNVTRDRGQFTTRDSKSTNSNSSTNNVNSSNNNDVTGSSLGGNTRFSSLSSSSSSSSSSSFEAFENIDDQVIPFELRLVCDRVVITLYDNIDDVISSGFSKSSLFLHNNGRNNSKESIIASGGAIVPATRAQMLRLSLASLGLRFAESNIVTVARVGASYFNGVISVWEPLLEPWPFRLSLSLSSSYRRKYSFSAFFNLFAI